MIHFVYLSIIAGLIGLVVLYAKAHVKDLENIDALDQGITEVTDAYESDSLQYEEMLENLREQHSDEVALLTRNLEIDRVARHEQAGTIDGLRRANDEYFQENTRLQRELAIAKAIIHEHDQNCLPHVVLSHMEKGEEDTPLPI